MKSLIKLFISSVVFSFFLSIILLVIFRWVNPAASSFINLKSYQFPENFLSSEASYQWKSIDEISDNIKLSVIASEDQKFFDHFGFDVEQIQKAIEERDKRVRGASTITQQVAKNLFLWGGQNFIRKGLEAYFTLMIELVWDKKRILEVYLNIAQFGEDIYGAEAAAQYFYNKNAGDLNNYEAAVLAAILPNPERYSAKNLSGYIIYRRNNVLRQMRYLGGRKFIEDRLSDSEK